MATMKLNDIFTKLAYVYKNDLLIINKKYVLAGDKSYTSCVGDMLCILTDEAEEILKTDLPDANIILINDIKSAKTNLEKEMVLNPIQWIDSSILNTLKTRDKKQKNVKSWKKIELNDEEFDDFFNKGFSIDLFTESDNIPTVTISKNLFPLLSDKNYDNFSFNVKVNDELCEFISKLETPHFTIFNILYYLDI